MSGTHYPFNRSLPAGFRLGRAHEELDASVQVLVDERDTMVQMRVGTGLLDSDYAGVKAAYGFTTDADAKNAFLELDSLLAKINTDNAVTTVKTAIGQFLARLRS